MSIKPSCPNCNGQGYISSQDHNARLINTQCPYCHGSGLDDRKHIDWKGLPQEEDSKKPTTFVLKGNLAKEADEYRFYQRDPLDNKIVVRVIDSQYFQKVYQDELTAYKDALSLFNLNPTKFNVLKIEEQ